MEKSLIVVPKAAGTATTIEDLINEEAAKQQSLVVASADQPSAEERLAQARAEQLRLPLVKLASLTFDPDALKAVKEEIARKCKAIPIKVEQPDVAVRSSARRILVVAMEDPGDLQAIEQLEFSSGCKIKALVATPTEVQDAIERYYAPEHLLHDLLRNISLADDVKVLEQREDRASYEAEAEAPPVKLVNLILQHAIKKGASVVHLEPTLYDLTVRIRISGILEEFTTFPKWLQEPVTSRIKIMAKMNIAERRRPQDGRIKVLLEDRDVDLRVSILPTHLGEKTVLRILGASQKLPETRNLGLRPTDLEILKRASSQPQGMIVVTGPTGSGKTTTLYSILNERKDPSINIVTIEDPIEIQLTGLNQVQVNPLTGMTFAKCMRSLLRQDPDVVLLGEIRDGETQEIALQAAQTGHLVLTTLHANSATAAISRFLELGAEPHVLAESIQLMLAQRLLRKICDQCAEIYNPEPHLLRQLGFSRHNKGFLRGKGCKACGFTGYQGRIGIYELLPMTAAIRELIVRRASEVELRRTAIAGGMSTLLDQAIQYVVNGLTTCEEVARVVEVQLEQKDHTDDWNCPQCSQALDPSFMRCPHCALELKRSCASCRQVLQPEWPLCPYCGTPNATQANALELLDGKATGPSIGFLPAPPAGTVPIHLEKKARHNKILVVDDVELNRRVAAKALKKLPLHPEVIEAKDGFEALQLIKSEKPDLILLDLMMPGMSGFDVCRKIREDVETAFIPIIMLTASTIEEHRVEGYLTGTDDYMTKPFVVSDLHARVTRAFRRTYGI